MKPTVIDPETARRYLVGQVGLRSDRPSTGPAAIRDLLVALRCIQLDPIDRVGTNADLVIFSRLPGFRRGAVHDALLPGGAFEHFCKERCLLPPTAWPHYRARLGSIEWWKWGKVMAPPPDDVLADVLAEVSERGPLLPRDLSDRGPSKNMVLKWGGKTPSMSEAALERLWSRGRVVVCGRQPKGKLYDVPERALPDVAALEPDEPWDRFVLRERSEAAGLLGCNAGPWWSLARAVRTSETLKEMVEAGELALLRVDGLSRRYLAPGDWAERAFPEDDGRMRVIAPLDPLVWDRALVEHLWGFDYVWEIYKPAKKRRWGYYVCPLLHRGQLVGRFEGRRDEGGRVEVMNFWVEPGADLDRDAFDEEMARLSAAQ